MVTPCFQPSTNNDPPTEAPSNSSMVLIVNETLDFAYSGISAACEGVARKIYNVEEHVLV